MAAESASRLAPTPDHGDSARRSAPVAADVTCDGLASPMEHDRRAGAAPFDPEAVRKDFPAIHQDVRPGVPLIYLDSAATSLKPWPVIRAVQGYDTEYSANVHRGLHTLSERATEAYESARARVARFIGATDPAQIVFSRGTTESINLVAQSWGRTFCKPGDEVVVTLLEHHSNLVPWQMLAREVGLELKFVDVTDDGRLELDAFERLLSDRTRLVAITSMSNVLGTAPPLEEFIGRARRRGAASWSTPPSRWGTGRST